MPHTRYTPAIAALIFSLFFPLLSQAQEEPSADQVIATVNGTEITLGHMIVLRSGLPPQYDQVPAQTLFDGILNQLIQQTLLAQSQKGGPSAQAQLMIENETRAITASEAMSNIMDGAVSEQAVKQTYESQYLNSSPETEYHASHILVETKEKAKELKSSLNDGADFAALAREFSTGPSGPGGGELGWFGEGVMVAPFFDAVVALSVGEVSPPVQTDFGWHVIKLNEKRDKKTPALEEIRQEIEDLLRNSALDKEIDKLKKRATIERADATGINPELINNPLLLEN